jgi:hypothetical protein
LCIDYKPRVAALRLHQKEVSAVVQYLLKAEDITADPPYYIALAHQLSGIRLVSSGGVLKAALKGITPISSQNPMITGVKASWTGTSYHLAFPTDPSP